MSYLRKYGEAATINFELFEVDGVDLRVDAVHVAGDTKIMKNEGAEANTDSGFVDRGQGYSIAFTGTEMTAARVVVYIVDAATKVWLDRTLIIETYGHASAQHAFDLDTASSAQTGDSFALIGTAGVGLTNLGGGGAAPTWADITAILADVTGIAGAAMRGTDSAATAAALATVDTVVDAIKLETDKLTLGDAGAGVTGSVIEEIENIIALLPAALVGGRMDSNVSALDNDNAAAISLSKASSAVVRGAAETGTLSTTEMTTDLTEATTDHYKGRLIIWTSGALKDQATDITAYVTTGGKLTYTATTDAPANTDTFVIV